MEQAIAERYPEIVLEPVADFLGKYAQDRVA